MMADAATAGEDWEEGAWAEGDWHEEGGWEEEGWDEEVKENSDWNMNQTTTVTTLTTGSATSNSNTVTAEQNKLQQNDNSGAASNSGRSMKSNSSAMSKTSATVTVTSGVTATSTASSIAESVAKASDTATAAVESEWKEGDWNEVEWKEEGGEWKEEGEWKEDGEWEEGGADWKEDGDTDWKQGDEDWKDREWEESPGGEGNLNQVEEGNPNSKSADENDNVLKVLDCDKILESVSKEGTVTAEKEAVRTPSTTASGSPGDESGDNIGADAGGNVDDNVAKNDGGVDGNVAGAALSHVKSTNVKSIIDGSATVTSGGAMPGTTLLPSDNQISNNHISDNHISDNHSTTSVPPTPLWHYDTTNERHWIKSSDYLHPAVWAHWGSFIGVCDIWRRWMNQRTRGKSKSFGSGDSQNGSQNDRSSQASSVNGINHNANDDVLSHEIFAPEIVAALERTQIDFPTESGRQAQDSDSPEDAVFRSFFNQKKPTSFFDSFLPADMLKNPEIREVTSNSEKFRNLARACQQAKKNAIVVAASGDCNKEKNNINSSPSCVCSMHLRYGFCFQGKPCNLKLDFLPTYEEDEESEEKESGETNPEETEGNQNPNRKSGANDNQNQNPPVPSIRPIKKIWLGLSNEDSDWLMEHLASFQACGDPEEFGKPVSFTNSWENWSLGENSSPKHEADEGANDGVKQNDDSKGKTTGSAPAKTTTRSCDAEGGNQNGSLDGNGEACEPNLDDVTVTSSPDQEPRSHGTSHRNSTRSSYSQGGERRRSEPHSRHSESRSESVPRILSLAELSDSAKVQEMVGGNSIDDGANGTEADQQNGGAQPESGGTKSK